MQCDDSGDFAVSGVDLVPRSSLRPAKNWVSCRYCQMNDPLKNLPDHLDQMAKDYREIRLNQPLRTSAEMRAQLERNRLEYASRPQSRSAKPLLIGVKKAG